MTSPSNGCVPLNIFGAGASSAAAIKYVLGSQWQSLLYHQHVVEADLRGNPFSTWAGPVSLALGITYRKEDVAQQTDALSQKSAFVLGNPQPYAGNYNVAEGFIESVVPLISNSFVGKSLDLQLAARETSYSTSGSVTTWKVGLTYKPIDDLTLRATRSRDIRAPSLSELYTGTVTTTITGTDPFLAGTTAFFAQGLTGGNANLKPEVADTSAAGIVYQPHWLPGASISVDYYNIAITNAIASLTAQQTVNSCYAGNQTACAQITRSNGVISLIRATLINLASLDTNGVDIEASYRRPLASIIKDMPGSIGIRGLLSYVGSFKTFDGLTTTEFSGSVDNGSYQQPHWTGQVTENYNIDKLSLYLVERFVGASIQSPLYEVPMGINNNNVPAQAYLDFTADYKFKLSGHDSDVYFSGSNLTNTQPPAGFAVTTAAPLYDLIGTMYKIGLHFKY